MSSGWQDAVAGLQSQVDTINSQISALSGEEASNSSAISSLRSQVSALQAEVLSLQQEVLPLSEVSAITIATLIPTTSQSFVQLVAGGDAQLPVASNLDGSVFTVLLAGVCHLSTGAGINISLYSPVFGALLTINPSANGDTPFYIKSQMYWDSTSQKLIRVDYPLVENRPFVIPQIGNFPSTISPVSGSSAFQFKVQAQLQGSDSNATLRITEFRIIAN